MKTYRASHPGQIILLTLLWLFFMAPLTYSMVDPRMLGPALLFGVLAIGLTVWNRLLKIHVTPDGITYDSGFKKRTLEWADIGAINTRGVFWGTGGQRDFQIQSRNPSRNNISFNVRYFRYRDLAELVVTIIDKNPHTDIDKQISKLIEEYGPEVDPVSSKSKG